MVGGVDKEETVVRMHCIREEIYFQNKKKGQDRNQEGHETLFQIL